MSIRPKTSIHPKTCFGTAVHQLILRRTDIRKDRMLSTEPLDPRIRGSIRFLFEMQNYVFHLIKHPSYSGIKKTWDLDDDIRRWSIRNLLPFLLILINSNDD